MKQGIEMDIGSLKLGIVVNSQKAVDELVRKIFEDVGIKNLEEIEQLSQQGYKAYVETSKYGEILMGVYKNEVKITEYKLITFAAIGNRITVDFAVEKTH